jgi:hypothetical protein
MEMMNFQAPFPALFHMQLANAMRTSYLVSINMRAVKKVSAPKPVPEPGVCGYRNVDQGIKSLVCGQY